MWSKHKAGCRARNEKSLGNVWTIDGHQGTDLEQTRHSRQLDAPAGSDLKNATGDRMLSFSPVRTPTRISLLRHARSEPAAGVTGKMSFFSSWLSKPVPTTGMVDKQLDNIALISEIETLKFCSWAQSLPPDAPLPPSADVFCCRAALFLLDRQVS